MNITDYILNFLSHYKNYKNYWNYEDGCILTGCEKLYRATGESVYSDFVLNYLSEVIDRNGNIVNYDSSKHSLDSFNSGRALAFAYEITGDNRYRNALKFLFCRISEYPRTSEGCFIHKSIYPGQVWLDGLYMVHPLYALCIHLFEEDRYDDILHQFRMARNNLFIPEKKLYCHGYDSERQQLWADSSTGRSDSFWLRSQGWYLMALTDTADAVQNRNTGLYEYLKELYSEAAEGILEYADSDSHLFYQVTDRQGDTGNYTETSGSLMISYALMKGYHMGFAGNSYSEKSRKIFNSIINCKMKETDCGPVLTDICLSAGLGPGETRNGTAEYYYSEKIVSDDSKGVGPLMMAFAEIKADDMLPGGISDEK